MLVINKKTPLDFSKWYRCIIYNAELCENSIVRGCIIWKPWGLMIWENIKCYINTSLKNLNYKNYYFPSLIPVNLFSKETNHLNGFSKECAVVTHKRLRYYNGMFLPSSKLRDNFVIRPTSESLIGFYFSKWIKSYRQLPFLINQWVNIIRWEMRTRVFLRNTEFLWQEGHTAHVDTKDSFWHLKRVAEVYQFFFYNILAIPTFFGSKTNSEKFPNAVYTFSFEIITLGGKAIQAATLHFFGKKLSIAYDIKYLNRMQQRKFAYTTSWGISTRVIGAVISVHSDYKGIILPPKIAPYNFVLVPLLSKNNNLNVFLLKYTKLVLMNKIFREVSKSIKFFTDELFLKNNAVRYWSWFKKGVTFIIEIGKFEYKSKTILLSNRLLNNKSVLPFNYINKDLIKNWLDVFQHNLQFKTKCFLKKHLVLIKNKIQFFYYLFKFKNKINRWNINHFFLFKSSFFYEIEFLFKYNFGLTSRCILYFNKNYSVYFWNKIFCIFTYLKNAQQVLFAKSF